MLQPAATVRGISKRMACPVGLFDAKAGDVSKPQTNQRPQGDVLGDTLERDEGLSGGFMPDG